MYLLEDRILFDGAAAVDVAEADQQHEQQNQQAESQAQTDSQEHGAVDVHQPGDTAAQMTADQSGGDDSADSSSSDVDQLIQDLLSSDNSFDSSVDAADSSAHEPVNVLIVSSSLDNVQDLVDSVNDNTILIEYDAANCSAGDLADAIREALDGRHADSIGFAVETNSDGSLEIFSDEATSLGSIDSEVQLDFWSSINECLSNDGRVDILSSDIAGTDDGGDLLDHIADLTDAEVAGSTNLTGDADAGGDWLLERGDLDLTDVYFNSSELANYDNVFSVKSVSDLNEVAFINSSVMDSDPIITELESRGVEIVELSSDDAFAEMNEYLAEHSDIDAIHLVTHGDEGYFLVGGEHFDANFLANHSEQVAAWGNSLNADADILIYGCDLADSESGQQLAYSLSEITGADVAASTDTTGADGNWHLEFATGQIESSVLSVDAYHYNLTDFAVTDFGDTGAEGQLRTILSHISDGDSISFVLDASDADGIITLTQGQLELSSLNISINGMMGDTNVTIDAAEESRHFYVNPDASVNLSNLNLINGHAGAGNDGGSVYVAEDAAATITNVVFNNTIDGTDSTDGVAVYNDGTVILENVTVSGFYSASSESLNEVAFVNSSVLQNDAIIAELEARGIQIIYLDSDSAFNDITEYLSSHSDIDAVHIITHGNNGHFLLGHDIVDSEFVSGNSDAFSSWSNSLNPGADILIYGCNLVADQSGVELVHMISDATGADVAASNDNTGFAGDWNLEYNYGNIQATVVVADSYMYTLDNQVVNSLDDVPVDTLPSGTITLRRAINDVHEGGSITFKADAFAGNYTITLESAADPIGYGQLTIDKRMTIDGTIKNGNEYYQAVVTNDVGDSFRLLHVAASAGTSNNPVVISSMIFDGGEAESGGAYINEPGEGNGGAIFLEGHLSLIDVIVRNSTADINGGGIYVANTGSLVMEEVSSHDFVSTVNDNTAVTSGGGIFNNGMDLSIIGIAFSNNDATDGSGGAIYSVNDITSQSSNFNVNKAGSDGGAIYIFGGNSLTSFSSTQLSNNTAQNNGGALFFGGSADLSITGGSWAFNEAGDSGVGSGGAIYVSDSGDVTIYSADFESNIAADNGGAIYMYESGNFSHRSSDIDGNSATNGAYLYMTQSGDGSTDNVYMDSLNITDNSVTGMGMIYFDGLNNTATGGQGLMKISRSAIYENNFTGDGVIYQADGDLAVWSTTIAFNDIDGHGGGIYFTGNNLDVEFATFAYNVSIAGGSDIYLAGAAQESVTIINSIIYDNTGTQQQFVLNYDAGTAYTFNNNIYTNFSEDADIDSNIATIVQAGSGNIVNNDTGQTGGVNNTTVSRTDIIDNLYLDTVMRDYGVNAVKVLPLLIDYNQDIAQGDFGWRNIAWQGGTSDYNTRILTDARGNSRTGWQFDDSVGVSAYVRNATPSIGAFEPIYELVVNDKGDGSTSTFDPSGGVTLDQAITWIDSYDAMDYAVNSPNLYNRDRYIRFDPQVFHESTDNTITISGSLDIYKSVIIGMTPWLNDQLNANGAGYDNNITLQEMIDWGGYRSQESDARIIVDAQGSDSVFYVSNSRSTPGTTRSVYLNNLTVTNGIGNVGMGGGIYNLTNLYLSNMVVTDNTAAATNNASDNGWGGGIYSTGSLELVDTTVTNNTASAYLLEDSGLGGGIYATGDLTISNSLISGNTVTDDHDSRSSSNRQAMGGGIYFNGDTLTIVNTTISENLSDGDSSSAGGFFGLGSALYLETGDAYLYYNTITLNVVERSTGGDDSFAAVYSEVNYDGVTPNTLALGNNIIASNNFRFTGSPAANNFRDIYINAGNSTPIQAALSIRNNIIGWATTNGLVILEGPQAGDANNQYNILGDSTFGKVANLNLETELKYNGGRTMNYKLKDGSVAYQNGDGDLTPFGYTIDIDQRGADRTYEGGSTTIGAYQPLEYIVVSANTDEGGAMDIEFDFDTNQAGWIRSDLELREALALADINTTVFLGPDIDTENPDRPSVVLNQGDGYGELDVTIGFLLDGRTYAYSTSYDTQAHAYTIISQGALDTDVAQLSIDGSGVGGSRIFYISNNASTLDVNISYVTMINGYTEGKGGAIYNLEKLTLDHVIIEDSQALLEGGAIFSQGDDLVISNSSIGTVVMDEYGNVIEYHGNTSGADGGGLYQDSGSLTITNSSFLDNDATGSGGGVYVVGAETSIDGSAFGFNESGAYGGGIGIEAANLFMINSTISNNETQLSGGGLYMTGSGDLSLGYVTIANNTSGFNTGAVNRYGGGLAMYGGNLVMYDSIVAQNYQFNAAGDDPLKDLYFGPAVTLTDLKYNVLGVTTNNSGDTIDVLNRRYDSGTGLYGGQVLSIDTVLSDNGGTNMTVWIGDLSTATIGYGAQLYVNDTTGALTLTATGATTEITVDQRDVSREAPAAADGITVGAYQKNLVDMTFDDNEGDGDYTNYLNWLRDGVRCASADELDFNETDVNFKLAADVTTLGDWTINWRSILTVNDTVTLTVDTGHILDSRLDIQGDASVDGDIDIRGLSSIDSFGNGDLTVSGAISITDTTLETSSLDLQNQAALTLATSSYLAASMNVLNTGSSTTVTYSSSSAQDIIDVKDGAGDSTAYVNLILGSTGLKSFNNDLTTDTLLFTGAATLDLGGSLTVNNAAYVSSVASSAIQLTGDLTLGGGVTTSFAVTDFIFDGSADQLITLSGNTTLGDMTVDNGAMTSVNNVANVLTVSNFTFGATNGGTFYQESSSLYVADGGSVTNADGNLGNYFITNGTGTVSLPIDAAGTHFVLGVEDGSSGIYKWTDILLTQNGGTPADRAEINLVDGITHPLALEIPQPESSLNVTWNFVGETGGFDLALSDYSTNAAGAYFDPSIMALHKYNGGTDRWDVLNPWTSSTTSAGGEYYIGHDYYEVWLNDDVDIEGTLRHALDKVIDAKAGVIVFSSTHAGSVFTSGANIVLNSSLVIPDGIQVSIFGLDSAIGESLITADGFYTFDLNGGGGNDTIKFDQLDLRGNSDYVLYNTENLVLSNVTVAGISNTSSWSIATIYNTGNVTIAEDTYLALDGNAKSDVATNTFVYETGATLRYMNTPGAASNSISVTTNNAEFGASIEGLTVDANVSLNLTDRASDYTLNGDLDVNGSLSLAANAMLTLNGTSNDFGNSFTANTGSTVVYDGAQVIDDVNFYNLVIAGNGDKDATDVNAYTVDFDSDVTLAVSGSFNVTNLVHDGMGTVNYDGINQDITLVEYNNLTLSGYGTVTIGGDLDVVGLMLVSNPSAVNVTGELNTGALTLTGAGATMTLSGDTNDLGTLTAGHSTIVYAGGTSQTIYGGLGVTYYNLMIANGNKSLGGRAIVNGTFTFDSTSGYLALGDYNLFIQAGISGASGTNGRYFVTNTTVDDTTTGALSLAMTDNGLYDTRSIVVGTDSNWSILTLENLFAGDTGIYLKASDGVQDVVVLSDIVDMTFTVAAAEAFRMSIVDSSAKGSSFVAANANVFYYNTSSSIWEDKGAQGSAILTNDGDYYFNSAPNTDQSLLVTNTLDTGFGSLRNAIEYANSHEGIDTIRFSEKVFNYNLGSLTIEVSLALGQLEITESVIIEGPGEVVLTVSGEGGSRVFFIDDGDDTSTSRVVISGLTITQGNAGTVDPDIEYSGLGGGIYNKEFLEMSDVTVKNSSADFGAGIYNDSMGQLYFTRVDITGNGADVAGGGIYNIGDIQMKNVDIGYNTADNGAGMYTTGPVDVDGNLLSLNSILAENVSFFFNHADSDGGAIYFGGTDFYGINVTIAQNTAADGSAIYFGDTTNGGGGTQTGQFYLEQSTIGLNTTDAPGSYAINNLDFDREVAVSNSIIANNNKNLSSVYLNWSGSISRMNNNYAASVEAVVTSVFDSLGNHGGWVQTLSLKTSNTIVLNSIIDGSTDNGATIYDARGYMRSGTIESRWRDLGAYEAGRVDGSGSFIDGAYVAINVDRGLYYTTIQGAIDAANNGDTIELVGSRIIVNTAISISDDIIIEGQGAEETVLDANGNEINIFDINDHQSNYFINVRVSDLSLTGVDSGVDRSAIFNFENLVLQNISIYNNSGYYGGAISNSGGFIDIERSDIHGNKSFSYGGAIYNSLGSIRIVESTISGNIAIYGGGGIYSYDDGSRAANIDISSSTLNDNMVTSGDGGAILAGGVVEITNSTIAYNRAEDGGAVYLTGSGDWKLTNVTSTLNTSTGTDVSAINVEDGRLFLINVLNVNNSSGDNYNFGTADQNIYNSYLQDNGDSYDDTIFSSAMLKDYGGWTRTIAIASGSVAHNTGTDIGVPGYDQRGYETNSTRDIGAYEYNGYIGELIIEDPGGSKWTYVKLTTLDDYNSSVSVKGDAVINLVNSRILLNDINLNLWYDTGDSDVPRAARNLTVYGHASGGTVISGGNTGRLFTLHGTFNGAENPAAIMGDFVIERLTLSDAIADHGPTITGVMSATNVGSITAREVTFSNNFATAGGGVFYIPKGEGDFKQIPYTVSNSTFENNISVGDGGVALIGDKLTLTRSTAAYNRSFGDGGAFSLVEGSLTLTESTVSFNFASGFGGGISNAGTLDSGGGLNLIAKNRDASSASTTYSGFDYYLASGPDGWLGKLTPGTNNLIEYQNGIWIKDVATSFYDDFDKDNNRLNYIGAYEYVFANDQLNDNGGWTHTIALSEYSVALDPESSRSGVDQRGYDANNWRDIGAMELNGTYVTLGSNGFKYSSIERALANAVAGDTITIKAVRIIEHDLQISQNLNIVSERTDGSELQRGTHAFIDAQNYGRVFFIGSPTAAVSMSDLYLMNGMSLIANPLGIQQAAGNGGAIYNVGTLTATHLSVLNSFAQVSGGAIYSSKSLSLTTDSSAVNLIDVEFRNNTAGLNGGAIYASGSVAISGDPVSSVAIVGIESNNMYKFMYNSAKSGGALYTLNASDSGTTPAFRGVHMAGNSSFSEGGAIFADGGTGLTIAQSYFQFNSSMSRGGAIYITNSDLTIWDTTIDASFAFSDGGAIYFDGGYTASMTIYGSSNDTTEFMDVTDNYSLGGDGGAIYMTNGVDLNIYSEKLLYGPYFASNHALDGDGGVIYFTNSGNINIGRYDETINNVDFYNNEVRNDSDRGHGGVIYMSDSLDLNIHLNVSFRYNYAAVDGGAIYVINSGDIDINTHVTIANNYSLDNGGGLYFENVLDITLNYVELANNWTWTSGGGAYILNSGDVSITDLDAYDNYTYVSHGGAIYLSDDSASNLTIKSSSFHRNISGTYIGARGGGIYVATAADVVLLENVTFAENDDTAFYLAGSTSTTIKYSTFAYNPGTNSGISGLYIGSGDVSMVNSIVFETSGTPIDGSFTITESNHNIFYRFDQFGGSATGLSAGATTAITAYNDGGGVGGSATVLDANNNIVGDDTTTNTFISDNLYLSTDMFYHANYLTRALALESRDSIAYHYMVGSNEVRSGAADATVKYDQRGNLRSGVEVYDAYIYYEYDSDTSTWYRVTLSGSDHTVLHRTASTLEDALASGTVTEDTVDEVLYYIFNNWNSTDSVWMQVTLNSEDYTSESDPVANPNVDSQVNYIYYEYGNLGGEDTWIKVTVDADGSTSYEAYDNPVYTSIGAFEPNFYITVTSSGDNTTNPEFVVHTSGSVWHDFDVALRFEAGGLSLRESIFWIDSYTLGSTANSSGFFSEDGDRYVKFASSMINNGDTTIVLTQSAEYISIRNDVIIGMVDNYTDGTNTYDFFKADNTFTSQDDANNSRIKVSGGNYSRVFAIFSMQDLSDEANNWAYSAKVGLNNITVTDGREDGTGQRLGDADGLGGGIYNEGTLTLHNVVVQNSEASNVNISELIDRTRSNAGHGGGIYTTDTYNDSRSGYLYIYDSTIDSNVARGTKENTETIYVAFGGGIYVNSGDVYITRSAISDNDNYGFTWDKKQPSQTNDQGAGMYLNSGNVEIEASTFTTNATHVATSGGVSSSYGDAIYQKSGSLTLNSNTFAYNRVHHFTNGEGVAVYLAGGSSYLTNNIFANNYVRDLTEQIGRDIYASSSNVQLDTNNIVGSFWISGHDFTTGAGNITGDNSTGEVDQLYLSDQFKYNGGMTKNYRLGANSVAIDAGDASTVTSYDQRGLDRATDANGRHSIGSYELLQVITAYTNVADEALTDGDIQYDYNYTDGSSAGRFGWETNLRNALYLADQGAVATINVRDAIYTVNLAEGAGAILIFNDITVQAYDPTNPTATTGIVTIDASQGGGLDISSRAFIIDGSAFEVPSSTSSNVVITGFNIANTAASDITSYDGHGGAIFSRGHLTFKNGNISEFYAAGSGGALYLTGGNLTVENVTISSTTKTTTAVGSGGAIYIDSGSIIDSSSLIISGAIAGKHGGAIYVSNATQQFNLSDSSIIDSHALAGSGGGIFYTGQSMILDNVTFQSNSAYSSATGGSGGALYADISGVLTITNSLIGGISSDLGNTASNTGGGIYLSSGSLTMQYSTVQYNISTSHGGGIYVTNGGLSLYKSSVLNNQSGINGGGIYVAGSSNVAINSSTVGLNTAVKYGGGVFINSPGFTSLNSTYSGNMSGAYGGAIYFSNPGSMTLTYVTVANNVSGTISATEVNGGGIYVNRGTLNMENTIVAQNYTGSVDPDNHNDLYLGTMGSIGTVTYSIIGDTSDATAAILNAETSNYVFGWSPDFMDWSDLALDTVLDDNGGDTMTVYVFSGSIAIGNGLSIPSTTTQDQRGELRSSLIKPDGPTIGAYEKREVTYYYTGPLGDLADVTAVTNWNTSPDGSGDNPADFNYPDQIFIFDNDTVTISQDWNVSRKNVVYVGDEDNLTNANVTLDGGSVALNLSVMTAGSIFTVTSGTFTTASSSYTIANEGTFVINGGTVSGEISLNNSSTLRVNAPDAAWENFTILTPIGVSTTVEYVYTEDGQTVRAGDYGNLTISGGSKLFPGAITVAGTLTVTDGIDVDTTGYDLTAHDAVIDGSVTADNITITDTADLSNGTMQSNTGGTIDIGGNLTLDSYHLTSENLILGGDITSTGGVSSVTGSSSFTFDYTGVYGSIANAIHVTGDSILTVDVGADIIDIRDSSSIAGTVADNQTFYDVAGFMRVDSGSTLILQTTGNMNTYVTSDNTGLVGNLTLNADNIDMSAGANFSSVEMLTINNDPGTLTIGTILSAQSITFGGDVTLATNPTTITVTNDLVFSGTVNGSGFSLIVNSTNGSIVLNDMLDLDDLTVNAKTGITLLGDIYAVGTVDFTDSMVPVTIGGDASITADNLFNFGSVSGLLGTEALALNITTGASIDGITNIGNLNIQGGATYTMLEAININGTFTSSAIVEMGANDLIAGGFINSGQLNSTGNANISGPVNNTEDGIVTINNFSTAGSMTNSGSFTSTGISVIDGGITNAGTMVLNDVSFTGNLTNTKSFSSTGNMTLNGVSGSQTIDNTGGTLLAIEDLTLSNVDGAQIVGGNLLVGGDFRFTSGKMTLNDNNLTVTGDIHIADISSQWFVTNGTGSLYRVVAVGNSYNYNVGNDSQFVMFTLTPEDVGGLAGMRMFNNITINGTPGGITIYGIDQTAGFTALVDLPGTTTITGYTNIENGSRWSSDLEKGQFAQSGSLNLAENSSGSWQIGTVSNPYLSLGTQEASFTGTYTVSLGGRTQFAMAFTLPGADFGPGDFLLLGLNNSQQNDYDGGVAPIDYPAPYNPYNGFFFYEEGSLDSLTRYEWLPGIITDPARMEQLHIPGFGGEFGFFPFSGIWFSNYDQYEMISIEGGTFHGMPNGEYSFPTVGADSQNPVLPEVLQEEEEEWLEDFMGLAHVNIKELFSKHEICKSDLDRMLDELVTAG